MGVHRKSRFVVLILALIIAVSVPIEAFACWICKKSPNYWGFCRSGYTRGHGDCEDYVADPWTGRTDCRISDWGTCGRNIACDIGDEDCEIQPEERMAVNQPCTWTDRAVNALV